MSGARIGRTYLNPRAQSAYQKAMGCMVSRAGGGSMGTMSNWSPRRVTWPEEARQREAVATRANDLALNNAHAASLIDSISINTVGVGLWPQSKPNHKRLGISEPQAREIGEQMEWEFEQWSREADATCATPETATADFYGIQFQNIWGMMVNGEFINLPLMLDGPGRRYSLALQTVDPIRLRTPLGMIAVRDLRDGIRSGSRGEPTGYFLADPEDGRFSNSLDLRQFHEIKPASGHRPNIIHRFHKKMPEQNRGLSILGPGMKFFRDMSDYLDFELVGAIVAASFPVFISKGASQYDAAEQFGQKTTETDPTCYQEVAPGQVMYGNYGEKPEILKSDRPGNSFPVFVETILRAVGAAAGMPYEVIAKDFSKTNYSSARAALEEAWRVFGMYQDWLVTRFCQVVWSMVFEEAWLRGYIRLPKGAPDFYQARAEWTAASWVMPERTNLDPVKEITAAILGKRNNMLTDAENAAKRGKDWEAIYEQRARERKKARELDLPDDGDASKPTVTRSSTAADEPPAGDDSNQEAA